MTTAALQPIDPEAKKRSLAITMSKKFEMEPTVFLETIKATCFPSDVVVTNEQMVAFLVVANEYGLNPFIREIYAFKSQRGGIVPIVPIDGWTHITNSHPAYDGVVFVDQIDKQGNLVAITAKIYRKDREHPVEATEYMEECKRGTEPWKKWPRRMLRHKAYIQAARYAFGFAGIYDPDEGERIQEAEEAESEVVASQLATKTEGKTEELRDRLDEAKNGDEEPGSDPEPEEAEA